MLTQHNQLLGLCAQGGDMWAVGAFGMIVHTSDGGRHWSVLRARVVKRL